MYKEAAIGQYFAQMLNKVKQHYDTQSKKVKDVFNKPKQLEDEDTTDWTDTIMQMLSNLTQSKTASINACDNIVTDNTSKGVKMITKQRLMNSLIKKAYMRKQAYEVDPYTAALVGTGALAPVAINQALKEGGGAYGKMWRGAKDYMGEIGNDFRNMRNRFHGAGRQMDIGAQQAAMAAQQRGFADMAKGRMSDLGRRLRVINNAKNNLQAAFYRRLARYSPLDLDLINQNPGLRRISDEYGRHDGFCENIGYSRGVSKEVLANSKRNAKEYARAARGARDAAGRNMMRGLWRGLKGGGKFALGAAALGIPAAYLIKHLKDRYKYGA